MICPSTWPNPRTGSARDACQEILRSQGLEGDVTYGNTKVFIKTAETIFKLEQVREGRIPHIVTFLQAMLR